MAHLKDLIVSGVTRFIGKVYGTITNAIKDDKDQIISSTYIKDITGVANSLTITKGDGTSSNVTMSITSDNATNADKLDGLHSTSFVNYKYSITDTEMLNNANYTGAPYEGCVSDGSVMGLASHWWHIKYFRHANSDGYGCQVAFPLDRNNSLPQYRVSLGPTWQPWKVIGDGCDADTVDGLHASDFMPINGEVRKYGLIRMNGSDGIRVRHIDGNDTEADGALYLNYNSPNATIYMNGGNTAIHSGNIGSQSVSYATNAGNANTVGGFADAYHLGTLSSDGTGFANNFLLYCKHNIYGDNRFGLEIANRSHEVRCDYATNASNADTVGNVAAGQIPYSSTILDARDCNRGAMITGIDGYTSSALNAPFAGWQTVMSYNCGHFLVQLAVETTSGNLAIRSKWGNTPFSDVSWVNYYGENYKPYVVGTFTLSGNETKSISLGFTPSYVDVRGDITGFHINVEAVITTNGFTATGVELTQNAAVRYIAFR